MFKLVDIVIIIKENAKKLFKVVSRGNYNTIQEENLLRTLKEQQNEKKQVNWETISEFISEKFKTLKTPKQCR